MTSLSNETLIEMLNWRYAVKRFDPSRKIPESSWKTLEQALVLSPSSYGLQPYQFFVVQNPELRKKLRAVSWNQSQVEECSHYVVILGRRSMDAAYIDHFIERTAEVRGGAVAQLAGYRNMMVDNLVKAPGISEKIPEWAAKQAYIAFGNLMTAAATLQIDACPIEGLDPIKYDEILNIKDGDYHALAACALGYRHGDDAYAKSKKVRLKTEELVRYL